MAKDERSFATQYDDASIKTSIASALLKQDASKANDINVHCFRGHAFLIGEADKNYRAFALDTANKTKGVVHTTTHWFPSGTAAALKDAGIEADIDSKLLFTKDVSSTQVVVDVWGGHVVLTGIMAAQSDIDRAVAAVKSVSNVKSVTSYLTTD